MTKKTIGGGTTADSNINLISSVSLVSSVSNTLLLVWFEENIQLRYALAQNNIQAYSVVANIQKKRSAPKSRPQ